LGAKKRNVGMEGTLGATRTHEPIVGSGMDITIWVSPIVAGYQPIKLLYRLV
jgi:hypothetical protein